MQPQMKCCLPSYPTQLIIRCTQCQKDSQHDQGSLQGPSPDEVALVECARTLGFEFVRRTATHTVMKILGEEVRYETLEVMEFSSERQRMSVIVRAPDGTIKICCKGVPPS
jgi:magnesium-transporting ATPase (P-type)